MTPKEKAIELTDKFKPLVTTWDCYWDAALPDEEILKDAKKCALICCGEIINAGANDVLMSDDSVISGRDYWNEVKKAISEL